MAESASRRGLGRIPHWSAALLAALLFALALALAPRAGAVPAGQLYVSGYNNYGQLGDGTTHERDTPELLQGLGPVTSVAGGYSQTLAVLANGTVAAWGYNNFGELGDGTNKQRETPEIVPGLAGMTAVAAGEYFSVGLRSDGTVAAWGDGAYGELGDGKTENSNTPVSVSGLSNVVEIAAGDDFGLALRSNGTVAAWGYGADDELGDGKTEEADTPVSVPGLSNVVAIAAAGYAGYALLANGTVEAWGQGTHGELGDGKAEAASLPVPVPTLSNVRAIAGGQYFMLALLDDGTVEGAGSNAYYELGDGTTEQRDAPVTVLSNVASISTGAYAGYALLTSGTSEGWGYNGDGELGDGTKEERHSPEVLAGLTGVFAFGHGNFNYDLLALEGAFAGLSGSNLQFPTETVGASSPEQSVTLTNNGPAPLSISGDVLTGAGAGSFSRTSDSCQGATLAVGATCTIALDFTPTAAGAASATLAISSSAANTLPTVSLSGMGAAVVPSKTVEPPIDVGPLPAPPAPVLNNLLLSPRTFRAASSGPSALSATATGTVISYTDTEVATATFTVQQLLSGVLQGSGGSKSCAKAPRHPRNGSKRCTYYRVLGSFTHVDGVGANRLRFTGRVAGGALKPGSYRLSVTAGEIGGRSPTLTAGFKIVKH
jgi:alpha-tubulin suppressor-like RCC1 family protein